MVIQVLHGANPSGNQIGDLATLLSWNVSDARDDFEMNRNNYIYTLGNIIEIRL